MSEEEAAEQAATPPQEAPPLPPAVLRRFLLVGLALLLAPLLISLPLAGVWSGRGEGIRAVSLLVGHGLGIVVGLSWLGAALLLSEDRALMLWPLRMGGVVLVLLVATQLGLPGGPLMGALFLSVVYAQILHVVTAARLANAWNAGAKAPPDA